MKKVLASILGFTAALCMTAAPSIAGTAALNAGNTTLAAEKISPLAAYTADDVNTAYQTGGPVAVSTILSVKITNGKFAASTHLYLCNPNAVNPIDLTVADQAGPGTDFSSLNLLLVRPLASGTVYSLQDQACVADVLLPLESVLVPANSKAGTVVKLTIDSVTSPGDPNVYATATILTVKNQFSFSLEPVTSKLNFADNMETFIASGSGLPSTDRDDSLAAITVINDVTINDAVDVIGTGCDFGRISSLNKVRFHVEGSLQGIDEIWYDGTYYDVTDTDVLNGEAEFEWTADVLFVCDSDADGIEAEAYGLEAADVTGTPILPGDRDTEITLLGPTTASEDEAAFGAGYSRIVVEETLSHDIQLDASQAVVPYLSSSTTTPTWITINNGSTLTGNVTADIITTEGGILQSGIVLGSVGAKKSKTFKFEGGSIFVADGTGSPAIAAITASGRYGVRINVNAPPEQVFFSAFQRDPDNGNAKRTVPVLTPQFIKTQPWKN